jgi:flagellar protein FliS
MNMNGYGAAGRYQQAQFATADRGQILLLMFDGGLRFLSQAEDALRANRMEEFVRQLGRAQAIIAELLHTLDHRAGGEVARQLDALYRFMLEHLVTANVQKSPRHVADVHRLLTTIADPFRQILADGLPSLPARDAA